VDAIRGQAAQGRCLADRGVLGGGAASQHERYRQVAGEPSLAFVEHLPRGVPFRRTPFYDPVTVCRTVCASSAFEAHREGRVDAVRAATGRAL
jgi:hypothetical protein